MNSRKTDKRVLPSFGFFRLLAVATIALLSSMTVSVPAQATGSELSFSPSQPVFDLGGPSPALVITSDNISMPVQVKRFYIQMNSGSRDVWAVKTGCTSTPSSTLSDCAVTSVKVTDNGVMTDLTSGVQVAKTNGEIEVIFNNELQAVLVNGNIGTRTIEVSLAQGAFTVSPTSTTLRVSIQFESGPNASLQAKSFTEYASVSFNGGTDSVGTMTGILSSTSSTLPANSFTKSGFNFGGWSCTQGGEVWFADQAVMTNRIYSCPTLYAVWTAVGSNTPPSGSSTTPASTTPLARLATTGSNLSAWAPALALGLGWMLMSYSRSLRSSRAKHLKI